MAEAIFRRHHTIKWLQPTSKVLNKFLPINIILCLLDANRRHEKLTLLKGPLYGAFVSMQVISILINKTGSSICYVILCKILCLVLYDDPKGLLSYSITPLSTSNQIKLVENCVTYTATGSLNLPSC